MLFSRMFNWIKYKTLPPSVLFLNRLFVERDSKHRRVTSNLGLTFRNSKWSTYARVNVNLSSGTTYLYSVLRVLLIIVLFVFATTCTQLYDPYAVLPQMNVLLWFIFDADIYLKALFSSSILCLLQTIIQSVWWNLLAQLAPVSTNASQLPCLSLPKRLHQQALYSWVSYSGTPLNLTTLFSPVTATSTDSNVLVLYKTLYRAVYSLKKSEVSLIKLESSLSQLEKTGGASALKLVPLGLSTKLTSSSASLAALEYLTVYQKKDQVLSTANEFAHWSLNSVQNEFSNESNYLVAPIGPFYLPGFSSSDFNQIVSTAPELSTLKSSADGQLSLIRWQRWLYRYNILHRSVVTNGHYLTAAKSLLSSGFYSSSLLTRNLWASSVFSSSAPNAKLGELSSSLYGNYRGTPLSDSILASNNMFYNDTTTASLNLYVSSYFWFIQRFYQFNTLAVNVPSLTTNLRSQDNSSCWPADIGNSVALFNIEAVQLISPSYELTNSQLGLQSSVLPAPSASSGFHLSYRAHTLFTKPRIETMQNITRTHASTPIPIYAHTVHIAPSYPIYTH